MYFLLIKTQRYKELVLHSKFERFMSKLITPIWMFLTCNPNSKTAKGDEALSPNPENFI